MTLLTIKSFFESIPQLILLAMVLFFTYGAYRFLISSRREYYDSKREREERKARGKSARE